ncbi:MAG: hypothetical protein WC565_07350 [Parcubacteria group bacterium]
MKLSEIKLCPTCVARAGGRFGVMVDEGAKGGFQVVAFARNAYPETPTQAGVYHVRTVQTSPGELCPGPRAGLLCRADAAPVRWTCAPLNARLQLWVSLAVEACEAWGDGLPPEVQDIPVAELEAAGARCEELATVALTAVARGDLAGAAERLAQAAQLELLDCGRRGGYARLHDEVRSAVLAEKELNHAQEA